MTYQLHPDIVALIEAMGAHGVECGRSEPEHTNAAYGAALLHLWGGVVRVRVGRVTPKKAGHFVSAWRRDAGGTSSPYDVTDPVSALVVSVRQGARAGAFGFSATAARDLGILSVDGVGGKRGFRVYPPWTVVDNRQARESQRAQGRHFLDLGDAGAHAVTAWVAALLGPRPDRAQREA